MNKLKLQPTLTASEKANLGLALSGADIEQLLKDPNSWISKLYTDCQFDAAISRIAFIRFVQTVMQEQALELASRKQAAADLAARVAKEEFYYELDELKELQRKKVQVTHQTDVTINALTPLKVLKLELAALLPLSQETMSRAELIDHHRKLTNNFNNQVLALLGASLEVPFTVGNKSENITLTVPTEIAQATASAGEVLHKTPVLAQSLQEHPQRQDDFARFNTLISTGPLSAIKIFRALINANELTLSAKGINVDDNINTISPTLIKEVDKQVNACRSQNLELMKALQKNNELSTAHTISQLFNYSLVNINEVQPSLTKHPAFFSQTPFNIMLKNMSKSNAKKWVQDGDQWVSPGYQVKG